MSSGSLVQVVLFLATLAPIPATAPALPATGLIHVAGFHRGRPAILFYEEVVLTGAPAVDLGVQQAGPDAPGAAASTQTKAPGVGRLLANRQNPEIAAELLRLIAAREQGGSATVKQTAGDTKPIEGLWSRNGRTYRIEGDKATVEQAGLPSKAGVAAGLVVMQNIVKAGAFVWKAEVLWQLDSERKWAPGTLTLSPDGNTLTRESKSPWNKVPETVVLQRK